MTNLKTPGKQLYSRSLRIQLYCFRWIGALLPSRFHFDIETIYSYALQSHCLRLAGSLSASRPRLAWCGIACALIVGLSPTGLQALCWAHSILKKSPRTIATKNVQMNLSNRLVVKTGIRIQSNKEELKCPFCGSKTVSVHSVYQRELQGLPLQDKQAILLVGTRKMLCKNPEYPHKRFAETHLFAGQKQKKTNRPVRKIIHTSTRLSSMNVSRLLKSDNDTAYKSSIYSLLKKCRSLWISLL